MLGTSVKRLSAAAAGIAAVRLPTHCFAEEPNRAKPPTKDFSKLRRTNFPIQEQWYGKLRVRVMKVRQEAKGEHSVAEYTVNTKLFGESFAKSYTDGDNRDCIATDTQKNSVYLVAKRTSAPTPEQFGIDLAKHFLNEYPQVSKAEIEVQDHSWERAVINGEQHEHGFLRSASAQGVVKVTLSRDKRDHPEVISMVRGLQVLKTTQAGWEKFYQDRYTTLPDTSERLVCTELGIDWTYMPQSSGAQPDYAAVRNNVLEQVHLGFFGPAQGGVYSPGVQATVYDIGCMVLENEPSVSTITINAPNLHQIPQIDLLKKLGEKFENDIYLPTSDPSGTIMVTVGRE
jgi:urate oxidase